MRGRILIIVTFALSFLPAEAVSLDLLRAKLAEPSCLRGKIRYEVYLPTSPDAVVYDIELLTNNIGDSLSACDYLISWQLPRNGKVSKGFSSYSDGNHFRYRDMRLQEYHLNDDPIPFTTQGGGVQRNAQFVELLPAYLSEKISEIQSDSTYQATYSDPTNVLSGVRRIDGYDAMEFSYSFDKKTSLPVRIEYVFNPAGISEQTVTAYCTWEFADNCPEITEDFLIETFPDVFEKFRESNFRVENLRGTPLPTFSYSDPAGARHNHTRGENDLTSPLLLVFVNADMADNQSIVNLVGETLSQMPMLVQPVYLFNDNNVPEAFSENTANGVRGVIRKMGVTSFPTFVLVKADGTIADVLVGKTANLQDVLSQSLILLD